MIIEKINKFLKVAIENSNIEKKDFLPLNKKIISIILSNTQTIIYLKFNQENIEMCENIEEEADLILEGSPIAFLNYFNNFGESHSIKISGNASLAESFSNIMDKLNIDWEQIISEYTNDEFAFYSFKFINYIKNRATEIEKSFLRNSKEYFRDETDIIPQKKLIDNYIKEVDDLKNKIEVMEAKLKNKK